MTWLAILCFALLGLEGVLGQTTPVSQCQRVNGTLPINVYVQGCNETPCTLPQREDAVINVVFEAPYLLHNMKTKALALAFSIELNYSLGENEITCNSLTNTYCPILKGEIVQYTLRMYIQDFFPAGLPVTIEFSVEDNRGTPIWCLRLPIVISRPRIN